MSILAELPLPDHVGDQALDVFGDRDVAGSDHAAIGA